MSSVEYVSIPLETDPAVLAQDVFEYIQSFVPNWSPSDGNLDVRIISAICQMAAESRDVASDVSTSIFRYFGTNMVNLPSLDGTAAQINLTFTARDTAGYTVPGGTNVQATDGSGNISYWTTISDAIILPGNSSVSPVPALSATTGEAFNGLTFSAGQVVLVDALAFVLSIASVGATNGGIDAESDADYLDRLREDLTLLSPKPIVPSDFAVLSKNFAGVDQAVAIDGYDLVTNTLGNAKTITVYVIDAEGLTPPSPTLTAIDDYLQSLREVGFVVYVTGPYYHSISTQYVAKAKPGVNHTDLKANIDAQIVTWLDPATWGQGRVQDSGSGNNQWENRPVVRISELIAVIQDVPGVDSVTTYGLDGIGATDIDMTGGGANGPVALPVWSAVGSTGSVT